MNGKKEGLQKKVIMPFFSGNIKSYIWFILSDYKAYKGLTRKSQNFRDHMSDLELIFTMLGKHVTTEISQKEKPDTFDESKRVAKRGGNVAGVAREQAGKELGRSVISL